MRRREFIAGLGGAAAWPVMARGQQPERVRRLGVLMAWRETDPQIQAVLAAFRQRLMALGWNEGSNLHIDVRWTLVVYPHLPYPTFHSTYSFVFLSAAALCDWIGFCSSSLGTRLTGPCRICRARRASRRTCRRDSTSSRGGPKTMRTIMANTNHPLIVSLSFEGFCKKTLRRGRGS